MSVSSARLTIVSLILLTGCGGESTGSSGPIAVTPAPTPTPTPTPTPSPTPTASAYDPASDFDRDRSFTAVSVRTVHKGLGTTSRIDSQSPQIGFDFTAMTREYRLHYGDVRASAVTTRTENVFEVDFYRDDTAVSFAEKLEVSRNAVFGTTYAGFLYWVDGNNVPIATLDSTGSPVSNPAGIITERRLVFGARTLAAEIPVTGTTTFDGHAEITYAETSTVQGPTPQYIDETSITIDWATRRITGTIFARRASGSAGSSFDPPVEFPFSGTISADGHITSVAAASGGYALIDGYFYGPQAAELGFVFRYIEPSTSPIAGEYVGEVLAKRH